MSFQYSTVERLAFLQRRMESDWLGRRGQRGRRRAVSVDVARDVLLEVGEMVALVGLHRPVRDRLVTAVLDALDHACKREPGRDYLLTDQRRIRAIEAAMAAEGAQSRRAKAGAA